VMHTRHALEAVRSLIRIYESEHDWPRAIQAVHQLHKLVDEPVPQLAHYQCELASAMLAVKPPDLEGAAEALEAAENAMRKTGSSAAVETRVRILRAQWAAASGDLEAQRAHLQDVLDSAPEYAGLVAE